MTSGSTAVGCETTELLTCIVGARFTGCMRDIVMFECDVSRVYTGSELEELNVMTSRPRVRSSLVHVSKSNMQGSPRWNLPAQLETVRLCKLLARRLSIGYSPQFEQLVRT